MACAVRGALAFVCSLWVSSLPASEPTPAQVEFFNSKIQPILQKNCFNCHSHEAKRSKGDLYLDSRAALLQGGKTGPVLAPGQPQKSLLIEAIGYANEELRMPPKGKLPEGDIALLTEWVKMGAPWPEKKADKTRLAGGFSDEDRKWWAIQPVRRIEPPAVKDAAWAANPIDRFIQARLVKEGLTPSSPAEKAVLLRRLTFDLTGLPPTPDDVASFLADKAPNAYEKRVEKLLASPAYGEHWARHWLDLVRYAESDGFRADGYRPDAWRYRDYVIRAFNDDKPYDRFVREQLAGDEIDPANPDVLIATSFLRAGIYEYNQRDVRTQWQDLLDDMTTVTGEVFLGLGMGCARCHDHKYDPLLQKDYYRLQAFFAPIQPRDDMALATPAQLAEYQKKLVAWEAKTATVRAELDKFLAPIKKRVAKDAIDKFPRDIQAMLHKPEAERTPLEKQLAALAYRQVTYEFDIIDKHIKDEKSKKRYEELTAALAKFEGDKPRPLPTGLTAVDVGPAAPATYIPKNTKGKVLDPGFLSILDDGAATVTPPDGKETTGRRLALAQWLTRGDHPLTTRVLVNRLWQQLLGQGLVATASDFGRLGEPPSQPELLDYLASHFVEEGWSIKKMVRLIVTSQTYRQSSTRPNEEAAKKDPENRLLWRARTRRLAAEQIRDAILSATGQLSSKTGGPSVEAKEPRRTVYLKVRRNTREPLLDVFDAPEGFTSTAKRNVTTTPVQALLMLNSPFMVDQAKRFAARLEKEEPRDQEKRLARAFVLTFGRPADREEIEAAESFLTRQALRVGGEPAAARREAFVDFCQAILNANEFVYLD